MNNIKMTNKVTVYIVNHNYGRYLKKAVNSVLNQTYSNLEIILFDDGSTDESIEYLEEYSKDNRIKVIKQSNIGLVKTIRKAFETATGEFVVRLDADDWLESTFVDEMISVVKDENISLVFPDYYEVNEEGEVFCRIQRHDFSQSVSMYDQPAHGACTLIRKSHYFEVGGHSEDIVCQDGVDIWLKLVSKYKVININKPLFYYRKHSVSLTTDNKKITQNKINIYKRQAYDSGYEHGKCTAIISIGNTVLNKKHLVMNEVTDKKIIDRLIIKAVSSPEVNDIIVSTYSSTISDYIKSIYPEYIDSGEILIDIRDSEHGIKSETLAQSIRKISKRYKLEADRNVVILTDNYPFMTCDYIDLLLYNMWVHNCNVVDSVMLDNSVFYYHDGAGLRPWTDQNIRRERDNIYIRKGGITATTIKFINEHEDLIDTEKMGHVIVDKITSHQISSEMDIQIANAITSHIE